MKQVILRDQVVSLQNKQGLLLHPMNGLDEMRHKYISCLDLNKIARSGSVVVLDVGFGVGYLSALFLDSLWKINPQCKVVIVGVENDSEVLESIQTAVMPLKSFGILKSVLRGEKYPFLEITLIKGDVRTVNVDRNDVDVVFYDLYPPTAEREVWDAQIFLKLGLCMKLSGVLVTHSGDNLVRQSLFEVGFVWDEVRPSGRFGVGTIARKS